MGIDERVIKEIEHAQMGSNPATAVAITDLDNVQTRNIDIEAIQEGQVIDISKVTSLLKQPVRPGSANCMYYTSVPVGHMEDGTFVADGVATWYPNSLNKRRSAFKKVSEGEYKAIPSMKASGTAHDVYATGRTMKESIVNLQKVCKYIQLTKTTPFISREYQTNNYVNANVGQWDIVG